MTIEIVDFPMKNGGSFHSYVSLPNADPGDLSPHGPTKCHRSMRKKSKVIFRQKDTDLFFSSRGATAIARPGMLPSGELTVCN